MRYLRLVSILEDNGPPQPNYLYRNLNDKQFIVLSFELYTLRLIHFVEVESDDIVIELGSIWSNELEGNSYLMLFIREVPTEVNLFERTASEVFVLDPYLIGIVQSLLIHLQVDQFHVVLYLDKRVFFLDQLLEDIENLLVLFEYFSLNKQPIRGSILGPDHKHSLFQIFKRKRGGIVPSIR